MRVVFHFDYEVDIEYVQLVVFDLVVPEVVLEHVFDELIDLSVL